MRNCSDSDIATFSRLFTHNMILTFKESSWSKTSQLVTVVCMSTPVLIEHIK